MFSCVIAIRDELAGDVNQPAISRGVPDQYRVEYRNAIEFLLPDCGVQPIVSRGEFPLDGGLRESARIMTKQGRVLVQEGFNTFVNISGLYPAMCVQRDPFARSIRAG